MERILYKFKPFINNSFSDTFEAIIKYLKSKYNPINIKYYDNKISPDGYQEGDLLGNFGKPDYLLARIIFTSNDVQLVSGHGQRYCILYLKDNQKISIFWDSFYTREHIDIVEFNHVMARKFKLEKLKNNENR